MIGRERFYERLRDFEVLMRPASTFWNIKALRTMFLGVNPKRQRQGLGKLMQNHTEAWVRCSAPLPLACPINRGQARKEGVPLQFTTLAGNLPMYQRRGCACPKGRTCLAPERHCADVVKRDDVIEDFANPGHLIHWYYIQQDFGKDGD